MLPIVAKLFLIPHFLWLRFLSPAGVQETETKEDLVKLFKTFAVIMALSSATALADTQAQCPDIQGTFVNQNKTETYEVSHVKKDAGLTYTLKITQSVNDAFTVDYVVDSKIDQNGGALGPVTTQISCENQALVVALQTLMGTDTHKFTLNQDGNLVTEEILSLRNGESRSQGTTIYTRQ